MAERILVTSALPYANGPIHLGHLAGAYLPADIFVRYHRLKGSDVVYICGSDEHGVPIMLRARKENVNPQEIVDKFHNINKKSFEQFGMSFDYYGRTSSDIHHRTSQDFFRRLHEKNEFIIKSEKQLFDPEAGMFLADRFVQGTCPSCGYEDAYGDQCEKCGISLSPKDLKNPRSMITNAEPVLKETAHWYLPLGSYQPRLQEWINSHSEWKNNVKNQVQSWFTDGLQDRAVTRDLPWGVKIPEDVAREAGIDASGKVLYVWFDAPIGYISATKEWAEKQNQPEAWKHYWQDDDAKLVHFIGKDNIVFHCLIFPAMLMVHGDFIMPDNVPANEFLNLEGRKLSTSRNYAVWLDDYLNNFQPDSLRYVLASNLPESRDTDFSWKDFQARHNNELADILGNFVNRSVTFAHKYFDGSVPALYALDDLDRQVIEQLKQAPEELGKHLENYQFKSYVLRFMDLVRFANKYFNDKEPWKTRKTNPENCATTIHLCMQIVHNLAVLSEPVLPFTANKIRQIINMENKLHWHDAAQLNLKQGHPVNKAEILFDKIEDEAIENESQKLQQALRKSSDSEEEEKQKSEEITIDDVMKLDLRVARITAAEKIKKADKLLKLHLVIGEEERQIIAGIARQYDPQNLVGQKIIVVANLKAAQIRGNRSQGMLLAAADGEQLSLLTVMDDIPSGSKIQ
ncbi:MAG: methionine--tRNA ligase [Caldithrix sp.]|nr:methionine--tRNA ligase [Caldithrix sp.]